MLSDYPLFIEPNRGQTLNLDAEAFSVVQATLPVFSIQINDEAPVDFQQGYKYRAANGSRIGKLRVINDNATPLALVIKAYVGEFTDDSVVINLDPPPKPIAPVTGREIVKHSGIVSRAGDGSTLVIHNPQGSGRAIAVTSIYYYCDQDGISFSRLFGILRPGLDVGSSATRRSPHSLFPTDSIADFVCESHFTEYLEGPAGASANPIFRMNASGYSGAHRRFDRPILIPQHASLYLSHYVRMNAGLLRAAKFEADVQFYEVPYTDLYDFG